MAKFLQRLTMAAVLMGGLTALAVQTAEAARPDRPGSRAARPTARRSFQLFAGNPTGELQVNRVYCGLTDAGESCTDVSGSPVLGGGSWPRGTPDQYVFNTGIQVVGVIPSNAGFAWAGDTVGAWAIDTRGPATHMQALTGIYSSLIPDDVANWPSAAYVNDPTLYNAALLGRPTISQQDTWSRYWDGSTTLLTGRRQTAGILVEQRTLAWNFPTGNEDLVYFLFRFTNITARASSGAYANLSQYGYSAADIAEIGALGDAFQNATEAAFNVQIPDAGYTIGSTYVAFTADMDVGDAGNNYATAALPFALATTWKSDWLEPAWQYPSNIFSAPFAAAPGFVGVKYLKSPIDPSTGEEFGITIFSTYTNPSAANSPFPDPLNIYQGYRYYQGTAGPATGDQSCQYTPDRHLCFLTQAPSDQRQMQSSGPFALAPGQSEVVVVAYVFAPPMATNGSFTLGPYIGNTSLLPGIVPSGDRLYAGVDTLRLIDRVMGWISHTDDNNDSIIQQEEVVVAKGSLLDKAMVAQAVFDNRFLLPFAPEAPNFYLIPGSNQVTVVWAKSATEATGDPYFAVASDPTSALYDPNFRQNDVEGYRIWRGRSPAEMELVIQYDYAGTVITDFTGAFYNADYNDPNTGTYECAPEIGITASCPSFPNDIPLSFGGPALPGAVQVPLGGRVALANGTVLITQADTAVTGGGSGFPALTDTEIPFAYVDNTVRNGYRYFYSVTAFDVNSLASGPTSLTSALITRSVTPRAPSGQQTAGGISDPVFIGSNGSPVAPISMPTIDRTTGRFSGPMPQTDVVLGFSAFVPEIVAGSGALTLWVDSVVPGRAVADLFNNVGVAAKYFVRVQGVSAPDTLAFDVLQDGFSDVTAVGGPFAVGPANQAQSVRYGGDSTYLLYGNLSWNVPGSWRTTSWGRGAINSDPTQSDFNGPRWWAGAANETVDNPNGMHCSPAAGACTPADVSRTAGGLPGVDTLFHVLSYQTVPSAPMREVEVVTSTVYRAADFAVYWGAAGVVDSVKDLTHGVRVPFNTKIRASWGILNQTSFAGTTAGTTPDTRNNVLTWGDVFCVDPIPALTNRCGGAAQAPALFEQTAALNPIAARSTTFAGLTSTPANGSGFIFFLNGHFFLMQMTALPTNTTWFARFYTGTVRGAPGANNYRYVSAPRPPAVPGLEVRIGYDGTSFDPSVSSDAALERVHTVPDPYYVTNNAEITTNSKVLRFVNLPSQAIVRIYSVGGILVNVLTLNDPTGGGELTWNLRNRNNQFVASGVYFYHVETPDGRTKVSRFTVVNYAQ